MHEVTSPQAFEGLYVSYGEIIFRICVDEFIIRRRNSGRGVRRPDCTLATVDHNIPYDLPDQLISVPEPHCLFLERLPAKTFNL